LTTMKHARRRWFRTHHRNQRLFLKIGGCSHDKQNWYSNGPNERPS
jgi:hypothetical protein